MLKLQQEQCVLAIGRRCYERKIYHGLAERTSDSLGLAKSEPESVKLFGPRR
jgi:hypothetical protein